MGAVILVGDRSSHGNVCTSGASITNIGGTKIAFVSSAVSADPRPHGANSIVGPAASGITKCEGHAVAGNGAPTGCGASMIASQTTTRLA